MNLKVSIITPTWNSEKTIVETTQSILKQDYPNIEHIIIDNLSRDQTLAQLQKMYGELQRSFVFRSEKDRGISDAFNKGVQAATGEIIGILNSDDIYLGPHVISQVVESFTADKDVMFVHGDMYFEDPELGSSVRAPLLCPITKAMPYNHPTFFVRKEFYQKYGLFDVGYRFAMDFELILRMYSDARNTKEKGCYLANAPLVKMRAGGASYTQELKSIDELERALRAHQFWSLQARLAQALRRLRIKVKIIVQKMGAQGLVRLWRRWKWGN